MNLTKKEFVKVSAGHYKSTLAIDLVKESNFKNLCSAVKKAGDNAKIVYARGSEKHGLSIKQFKTSYEQQTELIVTYQVRVPIRFLNLKQGQVRKIRPEFCIQNFNMFSHSVDFSQSEYGVCFFDEVTELFDIGKKQHTLTQCAAIAVVNNDTNMTVNVRVVAFSPRVSEVERSKYRSQLFYREIKGINNTSESELLYHKVIAGDKDAILTKDFYQSIPGFSWQPYDDEYAVTPNVQFSCTKVAQITKLVKMANTNDLSVTLQKIVQELANSIDWDKETPTRELNSFIVRGLLNFEMWLRPLLDDDDIDFDLLEYIKSFFATRKQSKLLGSTSTDKKPWQQLVKVAHRINQRLIEEGKTESEFFSLRRKKFVKAIYCLANPNLDKPKGGESVPMTQIKGYINMVFTLIP